MLNEAGQAFSTLIFIYGNAISKIPKFKIKESGISMKQFLLLVTILLFLGGLVTFKILNLTRANLTGFFKHKTENEVISITPPDPSIKKYKPLLKEMTGINLFTWDLTHLSGDSTGKTNFNKYNTYKTAVLNLRNYINFPQIMKEDGTYRFNPNMQGMNVDASFAQASKDGHFIIMCLKDMPTQWFNTWPENDRRADYLPTPYKADPSKPETYKLVGEAAFQVAARYGNNKNVDRSLLKLSRSTNTWENSAPLVGLGYLNGFEANNEVDRTWRGPTNYMKPEWFAAYLSASYDGHMGKLGKGVGAKNADPNMKVIIGGLADPKPKYVEDIIKWCAIHRGKLPDGSINLPFDVINFHNYNSTFTWDDKAHALTPEDKKWDQLTYSFMYLKKYKPSLEVYCTETGYDDTLNGSQITPVQIKGKPLRETVADWILRTSLMSARGGLNRLFFYEIYDQGFWGTFGKSGLFIADENKKLYGRKPSGNFLHQLNENFGDFRFDTTLHDSPNIDRYKNGNKVLYVLWVPDKTNKTVKHVLQLQRNIKEIKVVDFDYYSTRPKIKTMPLYNGRLEITITEKPLFIIQ